ncbi:MAG: energy transducer TonB [Arenimonas sp.]|uniref:energy transducer TonB n=1 Tax=Arenimonas sp. TaxID=1872635 RepID=UPI0025BA9DB6|nr:energy transducer TonB [Arenimonas sp.]MBW8366810.1 energy transducer TonB [Arenimonas sp.]
MFSNTRRALSAAMLLGLLAACSDEAPQAPVTSGTSLAAAPIAAPITDEAGLRAAAGKALADQRFYAPAGNSALDHYLALRDIRPDDANLATALLELLPYAVIGIEQAVARQDLDEASRLLRLLERADPQAPSLRRLADSLAAANASAVQAAAEAVAKVERDEAARQAERDEQAAGLASRAALAPVPEPAAVASPAAPRQAAADAAPAAVRPATARPAPPVVAAAAPATVPPPTAATATPSLLSAPSPRYPLTALRRKLEGQVTVQFTIQPDGSVAAPRVVSADPPGIFDEAALMAASRWRFESGSRSVPSTRVVQFRLGEG